MREAVGLPRPPGPLPLAFLHTDLGEHVPMRTRVDAAERLVLSGAVAAPALFAAYRVGRAGRLGRGLGPGAGGAGARRRARRRRRRSARRCVAADAALAARGLRVALAEAYAARLAALDPAALDAGGAAGAGRAPAARRRGARRRPRAAGAGARRRAIAALLAIAGAGDGAGRRRATTWRPRRSPGSARPSAGRRARGAARGDGSPQGRQGEAILAALALVQAGAGRRPAGAARGAADAAARRAGGRGAGDRAPDAARRAAADGWRRAWLERYLEAIQAERDAARNTLLSYAPRPRPTSRRSSTARGRDYADAGRADIEAYLVDQADRGMAQATRARRLSAIRQLYRFAFLEGWRTDDPAALIKGPKRAARRCPARLSEAEVDRLLAAAETLGRTAAERLRDTCLMQMLYATGLRVSELVSLPLAAVRGDPRMILVRGKGGRERMVPLSPPARAALAAWLAHLDGAEAGARRGGRARPTCSRRAGGAGT